jgi:hypothetical protein
MDALSEVDEKLMEQYLEDKPLDPRTSGRRSGPARSR